MTEYVVSWKIEVEADSHEEAAQVAFDILQDSMSGDAHATILEVENTETEEVDIINWENI